MLSVLAHAYGAYALTLAWNPYLPMMWWPVVLLGVWSLLCGDLPTLPVTVFGASFCMQTHVSYLALVGAASVAGLVAVGYWIYRRRGSDELGTTLRWTLAGVVLGAVLWFPPLAEQVTGSQGGNLGKLITHFTEPPEEPRGAGKGLDTVLGG